MKMRIMVFAGLLILSLTAVTHAVEECRAIPWGEPISGTEHITYSHTAGDVKYYTVTKMEPCGLFKIEGARVTYGFREGKLYATLVEIAKVRDVKEVVTTLMDSYGLPDHKKDEGWDIYRWETDEIKVKLKSQFSSDRIKVGMYYKPLLP